MVEISKKNQMITGRIKTLINKFNRYKELVLEKLKIIFEKSIKWLDD